MKEFLPPFWAGASILSEIRPKASISGRISFAFVLRDGNKAAHWIAFHKKFAKLHLLWQSVIPSGLASILNLQA